jgi:hypothetical protein
MQVGTVLVFERFVVQGRGRRDQLPTDRIDGKPIPSPIGGTQALFDAANYLLAIDRRARRAEAARVAA